MLGNVKDSYNSIVDPVNQICFVYQITKLSSYLENKIDGLSEASFFSELKSELSLTFDQIIAGDGSSNSLFSSGSTSDVIIGGKGDDYLVGNFANDNFKIKDFLRLKNIL